ncbi:nitrous oxide reductase accessory protein NosL [Thauera mechernichensis]|uniref:Nitrous oxide reductase accessory protein NosL n=1 Tax=Thauera mechernichensis TaxID=82788 RepID=A0ABW3WEX3_9RHOO|nr:MULTISPECIES: nitrous oxide reductase accessory protein NosL [Thauera]HNT63886.1 nitrous oxide reductase accessory protein NosL [Candidatus Desulfobacillus denitrificans]ENO81464.1 NosL family protein [Thauera sp. 27]ENO91735.1 NosL family protein [Thauera sp. 28]MDG3066346.1 nitrous oxide reductase accessory protein NosL [Thauera mechernichensis]WBL64943.1 nitrous oxide reductase accessory protein NosL [Thauera sp. WB-2]
MCTHHACQSRRRFLMAAAGAGLLAACGSGSEGGTGNLVPLEIDLNSSCALDGMLLADYPGPKVQMHYAGRAEPDWFCDTIEMFSIYLNPEQARVVRAIFVQDMGKADWDSPKGHWIDAKTAFYVFGSRRLGSMGPTAASFSIEAEAKAFADEHGGRVLRFNDVTPDMVVLDGGALHDQRM